MSYDHARTILPATCAKQIFNRETEHLVARRLTALIGSQFITTFMGGNIDWTNNRHHITLSQDGALAIKWDNSVGNLSLGLIGEVRAIVEEVLAI